MWSVASFDYFCLSSCVLFIIQEVPCKAIIDSSILITIQLNDNKKKKEQKYEEERAHGSPLGYARLGWADFFLSSSSPDINDMGVMRESMQARQKKG